MKKSDLKQILKPLIKECIKEVMFEDGVLSGIISEVTRGVTASTRPAPVEPSDPVAERMNRNAFNKETTTKLRQQKKKLMEAIGSEAYNGIDLFEGTTPAPAQTSPTQQASALSDVAPGDSGVSIDNLFDKSA